MADPRLDDLGNTTNAELQERMIRHAVYMTRFSTQTANKARAAMERAIPELMDKLDKVNTGTITERRTQELIQALNADIDAATMAARDEVREQLEDFAVNEAQFATGVMQASAPVTLDLVNPDPEKVKAAALSRPFQGRNLRDWYAKLADDQKTQIREAVRQGVIQNETIDQLKRRIRGTQEAGFTDGIIARQGNNAEAVARTATNHVSEYAKQQTYEQNANVVKQKEWVATLDTDTCTQCQSLDGQVLPLDGMSPPVHMNCRCTTAPVLKSWEEIGIDASEATQGVRASMDGQVPESMKYGDWLRSQVQKGDMDVVEEALGPKRAKLFAAGGLDVNAFTDRKGRQLSLDELKAKEPDVFERIDL